MKFGYARVSTSKQDLDMQLAALDEFGTDRNFYEKVSSGKAREQLDMLLNNVLREGDVLVVWKLDRFARSVVELVQIAEQLKSSGVHLKCIMSPIDTTTPEGRMVFHVCCALAEFERDLIRQRVKAGVDRALQKGTRFGRTPKIDIKSKAFLDCYAQFKRPGRRESVDQLIGRYGWKRRTWYKTVRRYEKDVLKLPHLQEPGAPVPPEQDDAGEE